MATAPPVLFIVGQPAAVHFLMPLWRKWLAADEAPQWRILARVDAKVALDSLDFPYAPILPWSGVCPSAADLRGWRPSRILLSATEWPAEDVFFRFALENGISTYQFFDTSYHFSRRINVLNGNYPDSVFVINEAAYWEAEKEKIPICKLKVLGHPGWEAIKPYPPVDPKIVAFASQPICQLMSDKFDYSERTVFDLVLKARSLRPDLFRRLLWAPHPREHRIASLPEDVEYVSSGKDAVRRAGTIIGIFTSLLHDAALAGRRVVTIQPNDKGPDLCDLSRHGYIPRSRSLQDLIAAMEVPPNGIDNMRSELSGSCERLDEFLRKGC